MVTASDAVESVPTENVHVHLRGVGARSNRERLLPLMVGMVVGLTLFFFIATFTQLAYLHQRIDRAPALDLPAIMSNSEVAWQAELRPEFKALAVLEANALERRYHQANVLLMSRVWARYLGFVTGMILALVGAAFILGKLREEASELSAQGTGASLSLRSSSPGLVLATLGVALMGMTIVTHQEITTTDVPVYLRAFDTRPDVTPVLPGNVNRTDTTATYRW
jgi:hypothetical protein